MLLAILTIFLGNTHPLDTPRRHVELIELNHFYDQQDRHAYDQFIFYEWSPDYRRYHVVAWMLTDAPTSQLQRRRDSYAVYFTSQSSKTKHLVLAKLFRETWTRHDPERDNKRLFPERFRSGLRER